MTPPHNLGSFSKEKFFAVIPQVTLAHPVSSRGWGIDVQLKRELLKLLLNEMSTFNNYHDININKILTA